ncbi:MAG: formimidoylglutamate deiminase [Thermoanaerobaculia bacterium]|nr:formimidoylglutamate deiminase [Thermoanaerobaculia bacterium]
MGSSKQPAVFHCASALLSSGWASDVAIEVDAVGDIESVEVGVSPAPEARHLRGAVVPGLPNVHSHAHQRAMAGLAERAGDGADSFWTWREVMYGFLDRMSPDDLEAIAAQLYLEMAKAGFTAVGEFQYLHHAPDGRPYDRVAEMTLRCHQAATAVGLGFTALPVLYSYGDFGALPPTGGQRRFLNDAERFLHLFHQVASTVADDRNASIGIAPHSLRAVSAEMLREVLDALPPDTLVHLHVAEQLKEVEDCLSWSGQRPVEWLLDHMDLSSRWCLIHATHMTPQETAALAQTGAVAGLCPTTEANLGDGIFPAPDFLGIGGTIAIGSDSHITVDPAEDLRTLEYGQRLRDRARNVLAGGPGRSTGRNLLDQALAGGARALGRPLGAIAPKYRADLVVLDTEHPSLVGRGGDDLLDSWIFSAGRMCIRDVIIGGRLVVADRRHVQEDQVLRSFRATLDRLQLSLVNT